jgi:outer membrane immunogenic protein
MKLKTSIACALAAAAFAPTAISQTFSGPYVGVEAGYETFPEDIDGGIYGAYAGWDVAITDNWVIGLEGRIAEPGASFRLSRDTGTGTAVSKVDLDSQYGISARLGRVFAENTLVFAQIGYEQFDVDASITTTPKPPCTQCAPTINDFSFEEEMPTIGAGVERALSEKIRARVVYTYGDGDAYERNRFSVGLAYRF